MDSRFLGHLHKVPLLPRDKEAGGDGQARGGERVLPLRRAHSAEQQPCRDYAYADRTFFIIVIYMQIIDCLNANFAQNYHWRGWRRGSMDPRDDVREKKNISRKAAGGIFHAHHCALPSVFGFGYHFFFPRPKQPWIRSFMPFNYDEYEFEKGKKES